MRSSKANRVPLLYPREWAALAAAALALGVAIFMLGCSTPQPPAGPPAGYEADTTPGRDGSDWIGGPR